jgi:3D (Asp-Asp-Asp) domain-containing protein
MKHLILFAVMLATLRCTSYCETGNPTASGVMPVEGVTCAVDRINGIKIPFGTKLVFQDGTVLIVQDRFGDNRNNGCDWYIESEKRCFDKGVWTEENVKVVLPE